MKAMTENDRCYSTIKGRLSSVFNTDGVERDFLDQDEVRRAFDFKIVKMPSFDENGRRIPGHYHLRREDTDTFIPSPGIGAKFQPVQHLSVYDYIVNDIMPNVPEMKLETVGTIHGCGTGIVSARVGEDFYINGDDSRNSIRLLFSNPCNGMGSLIIGVTTVRELCQNQIAAGIRQASSSDGFSVHHTKNAEVYVGGALAKLRSQIEKAEEIRKKSEWLANTKVNDVFVSKMLDRIYPFRYERGTPGYTRNANVRYEVLVQFDGGETAMSIRGDTAWKLFNSFTFPIFNPRSLGSRMDMAEISYSGAVGARARRVTRIFNTIFNSSLFKDVD